MAHDILIVDDEADIRTLTAGILEDEGFQARSAATAEEALAELAEVFRLLEQEHRESGKTLPRDTTEIVHA